MSTYAKEMRLRLHFSHHVEQPFPLTVVTPVLGEVREQTCWPFNSENIIESKAGRCDLVSEFCWMMKERSRKKCRIVVGCGIAMLPVLQITGDNRLELSVVDHF